MLHPLGDGVAIGVHAARNLIAAGLDVVAVVKLGDFPLADLPKAGEKLKKLAGKPIIVCCSTGNLAGQAARELKSQGMADAHALKGGIAAWCADNLPLALG